ncbi:hypothetical protein [Sphingomonas bacterium]|uniref:hypothetical protein n=1 Tax=Sphingomonas bacterium TaxID=1895847 RepID=UPI001577462F|nr:hypothetical protein [Sphingomonas bacterium]
MTATVTATTKEAGRGRARDPVRRQVRQQVRGRAGLAEPMALATAAGANLRLIPSRRVARGTKIPFGPSIAGAWAAVIALSHAV